MTFDELIRLKALQLKATTGGDELLEKLEGQPGFFESPEAKLRQVCAMLTPSLFERLEAACNLLSISKRKFMEGALIEALNRAETIVAEVNPFPEGQE